MKKILLSYLGILLIGIFFLTACSPGEFLSGAGGADATEPPAQQEPPANEPPPDVPPEEPPSNIGNDNSNSSANSGNLAAERFYLPTLTITVSEDGNNQEVGLSASSIGKAQYQLTTPKVLPLGEERSIELIVVPDKLQVDKTAVFESVEENVTQAFQGTFDIYPFMTAELTSGDSFSTSPPGKIISQVVLDNKTTIWLWYISALHAGDHKLKVSVSVPVTVDQTQSTFEITHIEFDINVPSAIPTTEPTITPSPSLESTKVEVAQNSADNAAGGAVSQDSAGDSLAATAGTNAFFDNSAALMGVIAAIITLVAAIVPLYQNIEKKKKVSADKKRKEENDKIEKEIKTDLYKPKNRK